MNQPAVGPKEIVEAVSLEATEINARSDDELAAYWPPLPADAVPIERYFIQGTQRDEQAGLGMLLAEPFSGVVKWSNDYQSVECWHQAQVVEINGHLVTAETSYPDYCDEECDGATMLDVYAPGEDHVAIIRGLRGRFAVQLAGEALPLLDSLMGEAPDVAQEAIGKTVSPQLAASLAGSLLPLLPPQLACQLAVTTLLGNMTGAATLVAQVASANEIFELSRLFTSAWRHAAERAIRKAWPELVEVRWTSTTEWGDDGSTYVAISGMSVSSRHREWHLRHGFLDDLECLGLDDEDDGDFETACQKIAKDLGAPGEFDIGTFVATHELLCELVTAVNADGDGADHIAFQPVEATA